MGVGEKCDSRVLSFCNALGVEYRASEALWWHYTELSVLLETQSTVNCKSNSSHSSCSLSFPTESQSLAMWSRWLSVSHPDLGNGRHYNSAFKTHLLKAKWNKTTATFQTHKKIWRIIVKLKEGFGSIQLHGHCAFTCVRFLCFLPLSLWSN